MPPLEGPLELKQYLSPGTTVRSTDYVRIFHRWIQTRRLSEELLVDVAEYSHVYRGPGVLLVGQDARYGIDESDGRLGLTVRQNRGKGETLRAGLHDLFSRALRAASFLATEPELAGKLRFYKHEIRLRVHARWRERDPEETFGALGPELTSFLRGLGQDEVRLEREPASKEPFATKIRLEPGLELQSALDRLGTVVRGE